MYCYTMSSLFTGLVSLLCVVHVVGDRVGGGGVGDIGGGGGGLAVELDDVIIRLHIRTLHYHGQAGVGGGRLR